MADITALTALCSVILLSHSAAMHSKHSGRMPCHCNHLRHFATILERNAGQLFFDSRSVFLKSSRWTDGL